MQLLYYGIATLVAVAGALLQIGACKAKDIRKENKDGLLKCIAYAFDVIFFVRNMLGHVAI